MPSQSALHGICSIQRLVICTLQISCHKILSLQPVPKRSTVIVSYFKEEAIGLMFQISLSYRTEKENEGTPDHTESPLSVFFLYLYHLTANGVQVMKYRRFSPIFCHSSNAVLLYYQ